MKIDKEAIAKAKDGLRAVRQAFVPEPPKVQEPVPDVQFHVAVTHEGVETDTVVDLWEDRSSPLSGFAGIIDITCEEQGQAVREFVAMAIAHSWANIMLVAGPLHKLVKATDMDNPDCVRLFITGPSGTLYEEHCHAVNPGGDEQGLLVLKQQIKTPDDVKALFPVSPETLAGFDKLTEKQRMSTLAAAEAAQWIARTFAAPNQHVLATGSSDGNGVVTYDERSRGGYL